MPGDDAARAPDPCRAHGPSAVEKQVIARVYNDLDGMAGVMSGSEETIASECAVLFRQFDSDQGIDRCVLTIFAYIQIDRLRWRNQRLARNVLDLPVFPKVLGSLVL